MYRDIMELRDEFLRSPKIISNDDLYIVGGFVRDTWFDRPVKDLDLALVGGGPITLPVGFQTLACGTHYPKLLDREIFKVATYHVNPEKVTYAGIDLLMATGHKTILSFLETFPLNISQCAIHVPTKTLITTPAFDEQAHLKDPHLMFGAGASTEYVNRITSKYPNSLTSLGGSNE